MPNNELIFREPLDFKISNCQVDVFGNWVIHNPETGTRNSLRSCNLSGPISSRLALIVAELVATAAPLSPVNPVVATRACPRPHWRVRLSRRDERALLIGARVAKGNSGNGRPFRRCFVRAASTEHQGLLKQILCSGREVIPLIGLWGAKRVQVRKHQDLAPRWTSISFLSLHSGAQIQRDKEVSIIYLVPRSSPPVRERRFRVTTIGKKASLVAVESDEKHRRVDRAGKVSQTISIDEWSSDAKSHRYIFW